MHYIDDELEKKWTQHEDLKQLFFLPPHDAAIIVLTTKLHTILDEIQRLSEEH